MRALRISVCVFIGLFLDFGISYAQTPEEYYFKGREYSAQGRFGEAKKEFINIPATDLYGKSAKRCIELIDTRSEKEFKVYLFQKIGFTNEGIWDELLTKYNKIILSKPNYAEGYYTLAQAYYEIEHYDLAVQHSQRAIELGFKAHPEFLAALKNRGHPSTSIREIVNIWGQLPATPEEKLVIIKYCLVPLRTFEIVGTDIKGVEQKELTEVLKKYKSENPDAQYELLAEVKSIIEIVEEIKKDIEAAGIQLKHYWIPTSTSKTSGPHGPGFRDIL